MIKYALTKLLSPDSDSHHPRAYDCLLSVGAVWLDDRVEIAKKILLTSHDDCRDGIFAAIWRMDDLEVNAALVECFEKWIKEDEHYGRGTGERGFMRSFLLKWISKKMFSVERLKDLIEWYSGEAYQIEYM